MQTGNKILLIGLIILGLFSLAFIAGYTIEVPYTAMVTYMEKEPYTDTVCETKEFSYDSELVNCYSKDVTSGLWEGTKSNYAIVRLTNLENKAGTFEIKINYKSWDGTIVESQGSNGCYFESVIPYSTVYCDNQYYSERPVQDCLYEIKAPTKTECKEVTKYRDIQKQRTEIMYQTLFQEWGLT